MNVSDEAHVDGLIDDLDTSPDWRTGAPAAARQLLGRLPQTPATALQRARLTLLSTHEAVRARDAADAALTILGVRDLAVRRGHQALEARAEQALSGLFREIGDPSASMEHAVAALALDGDDLDPVLRCRLSLTMADAHARAGSLERSRGHYDEALERSRVVTAPWLSLHVLNNWTYTELVAGALGTAGDLADRLQALGEQDDATLLLGYVDTVVEVLHARGRSTEAIAMLRERLSTDPADAVVDAADCWLLLAQMERETGDLDASGLSLDAADRLTARDELQELRVQAMGERATLHAVFDVDGARRESARYRTLSYRDPLTALLNRRHVDEDLDDRSSRGSATTRPLAIAMLDLDHFKAVNDTCSHEAGDAVRVRLAGMLEDAARSPPTTGPTSPPASPSPPASASPPRPAPGSRRATGQACSARPTTGSTRPRPAAVTESNPRSLHWRLKAVPLPDDGSVTVCSTAGRRRRCTRWTTRRSTPSSTSSRRRRRGAATRPSPSMSSSTSSQRPLPRRSSVPG